MLVLHASVPQTPLGAVGQTVETRQSKQVEHGHPVDGDFHLIGWGEKEIADAAAIAGGSASILI